MTVSPGRHPFALATERSGDLALFRLRGVIDETADLTPLVTTRCNRMLIHAGQVRRINSFGVRVWVDAIRRIPASVDLLFVELSPALVDQCNMLRDFLGTGTVHSFYAPMICEPCDEQSFRLFETRACQALGGRLPRASCPRCERAMTLDDLEDQYLLFLRDEGR